MCMPGSATTVGLNSPVCADSPCVGVCARESLCLYVLCLCVAIRACENAQAGLHRVGLGGHRYVPVRPSMWQSLSLCGSASTHLEDVCELWFLCVPVAVSMRIYACDSLCVRVLPECLCVCAFVYMGGSQGFSLSGESVRMCIYVYVCVCVWLNVKF